VIILSKCKWCGEEFEKKHNRQMYCNEYCSKEAERENTRKRRIKHYYRYKNIMHEEQKYGLGSGFLSIHRYTDESKEFTAIQNEMKRLKIKT